MIPQKSIDIAAAWWANQLRGKAKQDNGDALTGVFVSLMRDLSAIKITEEHISIFETALKEAIAKEIKDSRRIEIAVDYHPEGCLDEAIIVLKEKTGLDLPSFSFPMKTCMILYRNGELSLKHGYYAQWQTLCEATKESE